MKSAYRAHVITIAMVALFIFGYVFAFFVWITNFTPNFSSYKESMVYLLIFLWIVPAVFIFFFKIENIKQRIFIYILMVFMLLITALMVIFFFLFPVRQIIDCNVIRKASGMDLIVDCEIYPSLGDRLEFKISPGSITMEVVTDSN